MVGNTERGRVDLVCGVLGDDAPRRRMLSRLRAASLDSNPGLSFGEAACGRARLFHASRAFAASESGSAPGMVLQGRLSSIDGRQVHGESESGPDWAALRSLLTRSGDGMWSRIDGSFLLAVEDDAAFHLGVDVGGARSVYWWHGEGLFAFHSHLFDLVAGIDRPLTPDLGAIAQFLACGSYPPRRTAFREVGHLGAGQYLEVRDGRPTVRDHFTFVSHDQARDLSTERFVGDLIERLALSIAGCRDEAERPVVPLSGGLDSRYLAAELVATSDPGSIQTITWGEEASRLDADGVVARRVAAALGVPNAWHEKPQRHTLANVERTLYLSSGEADCAIHFPDDVALHAELSAEGYGSLYRGDECFGASKELLTDRAILAVNGIALLNPSAAMGRLLPADMLSAMHAEQEADLETAFTGLGSPTPTGRRDEIYYAYRVRRLLAPYNRVKIGDLEVFTPYLARSLLEWLRTVPDGLRSEKRLLALALARRFPDLAAISFARTTNLPDWDRRAASEPGLARFWREWCERSGWLDGIGAAGEVRAALEGLERRATAAAAGMRQDEMSGARAAPPAESVGVRASAALRRAVKSTMPGRLLRELTLNRRFTANNLPPYLWLARLCVLHEVLGQRVARQSRIATIAATSDSLST